jgi:glutamate synthase domain-containing protein 3
MCGIVGLLLKDATLRPQLGELMVPMLIGMTERGPDSSGMAVFADAVAADRRKLSLYCAHPGFEWRAFEGAWVGEIGAAQFEVNSNHCIVTTTSGIAAAREWIAINHPQVQVLSAGRSIDLYKDLGLPVEVAERYGFQTLTGTHLVGHTRMATESAVTIENAHPYTAGEDWCLVHNGSLANPGSLRRKLEKLGERFESDCDTEGACRYLHWRLSWLFHFSDGHARQAGAGARSIRVQTGGGSRDRRVCRHRFRVSFAGALARRQTCHRIRAQAGTGVRMVSVMTDARQRVIFDLKRQSVRELNQFLHGELDGVREVLVENPDGAHSLAVGLNAAVRVDIGGHAGYYAAGMNKTATVVVHGNAGPGVAENMMSGRVEVSGFASGGAGASAHGGLLIIRGDAGLRCGISLKGADIVVGGEVGNFSAFMAQAGRIVICGDAGDGLGDSLYEAVIYVRGAVRSLGADARIEPMSERDHGAVRELLAAAGLSHPSSEFKRIASSRSLYHWNADARQSY